MSYKSFSQKLTLIEKYIENKWANTPSSIAEKLNISERTVLRMIDFLRNVGKKITYCKKEKIYKID